MSLCVSLLILAVPISRLASPKDRILIWSVTVTFSILYFRDDTAFGWKTKFGRSGAGICGRNITHCHVNRFVNL